MITDADLTGVAVTVVLVLLLAALFATCVSVIRGLL